MQRVMRLSVAGVYQHIWDWLEADKADAGNIIRDEIYDKTPLSEWYAMTADDTQRIRSVIGTMRGLSHCSYRELYWYSGEHTKRVNNVGFARDIDVTD